MDCFLCKGEEVVRVRGDVYERSYPCPECRIVSYHVVYEMTGFAMSQAAEGVEEKADEIKRTLRDRLLYDMTDQVGEFGHEHELSDDKHKFTARVVVVHPRKKGS